MVTVKIEIKSRWDAKTVLYTAEVPESTPSSL